MAAAELKQRTTAAKKDIDTTAVASSEHANGHTNGHTNGHANGHANDHANGHATNESSGTEAAESDDPNSYGAGAPIVSGNSSDGIFAYPPLSWILFFFRLFFTWKFIVHRQGGLWFLVMWFATFFLYFYDYDAFYNSFMIWALPTLGTLQAISAALTFTFLSKKKVDQGYFSDKQTVSLPFVIENSFFALIAVFGWMYMNDRFYPFFTKSVFIEVAFVFFPYYFRHAYWPKTSFRDSYVSDQDSNRSKENKLFYVFAIFLTKFFYIWGKHVVGNYINYARYLDRLTYEQIRHVYIGLIFGAFALTVGIFLHTLKFKKYIGPRTSFAIYAASYIAMLSTFFGIWQIFQQHLDLTIITLIGIAINFTDRRWQNLYQVFVFGLLASARYGLLPESFHETFGFRVGQNA